MDGAALRLILFEKGSWFDEADDVPRGVDVYFRRFKLSFSVFYMLQFLREGFFVTKEDVRQSK